MLSPIHRIINGRKSRGFSHWTLRDIFFKPGELSSKTKLLDEFAEGLASQNGQAWDKQFATDIKNHLFEGEDERGQGGMDLIALNIQRGRDHGLPGKSNKSSAMLLTIKWSYGINNQ